MGNKNRYPSHNAASENIRRKAIGENPNNSLRQVPSTITYKPSNLALFLLLCCHLTQVDSEPLPDSKGEKASSKISNGLPISSLNIPENSAAYLFHQVQEKAFQLPENQGKTDSESSKKPSGKNKPSAPTSEKSNQSNRYTYGDRSTCPKPESPETSSEKKKEVKKASPAQTVYSIPGDSVPSISPESAAHLSLKAQEESLKRTQKQNSSPEEHGSPEQESQTKMVSPPPKEEKHDSKDVRGGHNEKINDSHAPCITELAKQSIKHTPGLQDGKEQEARKKLANALKDSNYNNKMFIRGLLLATYLNELYHPAPNKYQIFGISSDITDQKEGVRRSYQTTGVYPDYEESGPSVVAENPYLDSFIDPDVKQNWPLVQKIAHIALLASQELSLLAPTSCSTAICLEEAVKGFDYESFPTPHERDKFSAGFDAFKKRMSTDTDSKYQEIARKFLEVYPSIHGEEAMEHFFLTSKGAPSGFNDAACKALSQQPAPTEEQLVTLGKCVKALVCQPPLKALGNIPTENAVWIMYTGIIPNKLLNIIDPIFAKHMRKYEDEVSQRLTEKLHPSDVKRYEEISTELSSSEIKSSQRTPEI